MLDSRWVAMAQNARLVLGTVQKHPGNPLMAEDHPWEARFDNLYANVIHDPADNLYKCWYSPFIVDLPAKGLTPAQRKTIRYRPPAGREMGVCYAVSHDGLLWEKPGLHLVDFEGTGDNNLVVRGPHGAGILLDPADPDPERRYNWHRPGAGRRSPLRADGDGAWRHADGRLDGGRAIAADLLITPPPVSPAPVVWHRSSRTSLPCRPRSGPTRSAPRSPG